MTKETNYKLLDCGDFEKLEQVGDYIFRRSAPQANWQRKLDKEIWNNFNARFDALSSEWIVKSEKELPVFVFSAVKIQTRLSANGQIGVFPEQMTNWQWVEDIVSKSANNLSILNGFAYTGAMSIASSSSMSEVTHIDAASSSVNWARENSIVSNKQDNKIRWITEDILTFLKREGKRGNRYDGIILDPPAFGRSKKGGIWKIGKDMPKLIKLVEKVLSTNPDFFILSCHDQEFGVSELRTLLNSMQKLKKGSIDTFTLAIESEHGNDLPAGTCARWRKQA